MAIGWKKLNEWSYGVAIGDLLWLEVRHFETDRGRWFATWESRNGGNLGEAYSTLKEAKAAAEREALRLVREAQRELEG